MHTNYTQYTGAEKPAKTVGLCQEILGPIKKGKPKPHHTNGDAKIHFLRKKTAAPKKVPNQCIFKPKPALGRTGGGKKVRGQTQETV